MSKYEVVDNFLEKDTFKIFRNEMEQNNHFNVIFDYLKFK